MIDREDLSPFGTAKSRFATEERARARSGFANAPSRSASQELKRRRSRKERLLTTVKQRLRQHDIAPDIADLAWELVSLASLGEKRALLSPEKQEALLQLLLAVLINLRRGSTRLPVLGAEGDACLREILTPLMADGDLEVIERIRQLLTADLSIIGRSEESYTPLVFVAPHLYLQRMLRQEIRLAAAIRARLTEAKQTDRVEQELARLLRKPGDYRVSAEQQEAVLSAATRALTVISGGPGTGKTSIVVVLLRLLVRLGVDPDAIALAAPTGKAANRLAESVRAHLEGLGDLDESDRLLLERSPKPETLHRLLGYSPTTDRFRHHEDNQLSERMVIIDESSMIDLMMMERLLAAVAQDARLVLLGDAEQLPSVDAGAVLRDVRETNATIELTETFRMDAADPAGRQLLQVAGQINRGGPVAIEEQTATEIDFCGVSLITRDEDRRTFLDRWFTERIHQSLPNAGSFSPSFASLTRRRYATKEGRFSEADAVQIERVLAHLSRFKILCLTRRAGQATGAEAINASLHARFAQQVGVGAHASDLYPGEPIIIERNDYERGLFNGDLGVVLNIEPDNFTPGSMAVFRTDAGIEAFQIEPLRHELALAHAMTVHKAQGSELDHVALFLPEVDMALLTREILYTAVTRARKSVTILGKRELLDQGAGKVIRRYSGIAERMR